jgi:hypothetical protein
VSPQLACGSRLVALVTVGAAALAVTVPAAPARIEPTATCPTAGALVVYYVTEGLSYKNDLVIGPDGRAALCWSRSRPTVATGQSTFVLSRPTLDVLRATLDRIDVEHLAPPQGAWPPRDFARTAALVYRGMGIPYGGRPSTASAARAFRRAQAILERIIERHEPDL